MSDCPNVMTLNRYVSGALEQHMADDLAFHLTKCERCQIRVDQMSEQPDTLLQVVRRTQRQSAAGAEPQLADLIAEAQRFGPNHENTLDLKDENNATVTIRERSTDRVKHSIADLDSFIACLRKSRLVDEIEIDTRVSSTTTTTTEGFAEELVKENVLTPYQAKILSRGRWKGLILGNYVIQERLGQGGMGQVYKARHQRMGRIVCIKVLHALGRKSPEIVERFRREIKAISSLNHPNFVIAHDADEADGIQFLVMEFIDGSDLSRLVKRQGPVPVDDAVEIIRQASRALEYAHQAGVIHRDIKPHNLLLTSSETNKVGLVKVLDMGLARFDSVFTDDSISGTQASMTATGVIMGTVDYIAPEQALNSRNADGRSDIYSLGCTLHFLLTGRPLFPGQTIMEKLINHREQQPPRLQDAVPTASASLNAVFRKMVAKDPDDRYQSMTALAEDLEALQAGRRPQAMSSLWLRLSDSLARNPWPAISSGAAVFVVGLAIWLIFGGSNSAAHQASTNGDRGASGNEYSKSNDPFFDEFGRERGVRFERDDSTAGKDSVDQPAQNRSTGRPKVVVLIPYRDYDPSEVNSAKLFLERNNFEPVLASSQFKAYSRNSDPPIQTMNFSESFNSNDFFGVVVVSAGRNEFKNASVIRLLKETLEADGVVAGIGSGANLISEMGLCDGQCLHQKEDIKVDLDHNTRGSVILAEAKRIDRVAMYMKKIYSSNEY